MLVAIVTAPGRPASAIVSPSRSAYSGLALRTVCGIPFLLSCSPSSSETSTEIVPTSTGWPAAWRASSSRTTARHLPSLVLKTWSFSSWRTIGRFVGTWTTGSL